MPICQCHFEDGAAEVFGSVKCSPDPGLLSYISELPNTNSLAGRKSLQRLIRWGKK